jgi:hypothetical protein
MTQEAQQKGGRLDPAYVISGLVRRGVPLHTAQGVTARLHGESGLDPGINEIAPVVRGSRGGFGLAQWTGPRRRQLEAFAKDRGVPVSDPEMQLDFLMWENENTEKGAWQKVMQAPDAVSAAEAFTVHWERPGKPHLAATLNTARKYAGITPQSGMEAEGPGRTDRNPERLAWAYANGRMSPEDAAIYERGMKEGVFPKAGKPEAQQQPERPDPAAVYAATAMQPRRPFQPVALQSGPVENATPFAGFPAFGRT